MSSFAAMSGGGVAMSTSMGEIAVIMPSHALHVYSKVL
jgi:hypothetical protein